jgi:FtsP/CotA-like multicopper oxidase with cupredoxin domain
MEFDRRRFLHLGSAAAVGGLLPELGCRRGADRAAPPPAADYTLRIATGPVELAPGKSITTTTFNAQFPGPLVRLTEGRPVTVDIHNDTDVPEQLHWHGQTLPVDVDGSGEEGTPFVPARGLRRITFTPGPSGLRFYHTHLRAGRDLNRGQYGGLVGPVYIEPRINTGAYDREVFLVLKEFEPALSKGGDMAMDFLAGAEVAALKQEGEKAMKASLAAGAAHGYEVGYRSFTINGRMLGAGEPVRVKTGERVLFHVVNGSATEIRSLALPGHTFRVVALDGNPVASSPTVAALWLGTGERVSAIVEMNRPGVWVLGDLSDDDRNDGMGIVVEYAGQTGKPAWRPPSSAKWDYSWFGQKGANPKPPDETLELLMAKDNAADEGFNRWTINGRLFAMERPEAMFRLRRGGRYRLRLRNASDDIHPIHLHRHTFEVTRLGGVATAGIMKDVVMLGSYQEMEIDFTADQPGRALFHCHQQLHMDFGFMVLFDCA